MNSVGRIDDVPEGTALCTVFGWESHFSGDAQGGGTFGEGMPGTSAATDLGVVGVPGSVLDGAGTSRDVGCVTGTLGGGFPAGIAEIGAALCDIDGISGAGGFEAGDWGTGGCALLGGAGTPGGGGLDCFAETTDGPRLADGVAGSWCDTGGNGPVDCIPCDLGGGMLSRAGAMSCGDSLPHDPTKTSGEGGVDETDGILGGSGLGDVAGMSECGGFPADIVEISGRGALFDADGIPKGGGLFGESCKSDGTPLRGAGLSDGGGL